MPRDGWLSLLSLLLALALAFLVGSFLGWSSNPDKSAAFAAAHLEMARSGISGSLEELQKRQYELAQKQPGFDSPDPHITIAILKTHPSLLAVFSLVFLCLLRPSWAWAAVVFVPVTLATYFFIGVVAALSVLVALTLSIVWSFTYARLKKKSAP
jgi:uncharacterized membrane protein (DUF106 family)